VNFPLALRPLLTHLSAFDHLLALIIRTILLIIQINFHHAIEVDSRRKKDTKDDTRSVVDMTTTALPILSTITDD
jgi:hypothetical protein